MNEVVEVEAALQVLEAALDGAAVIERQRRQRPGPGFAQVIGLRILQVLAQEIRRPGLAAERDLVALVDGEQRAGAALVEKPLEADVDREDRGECDHQHGRDECHAALAAAAVPAPSSAAHPATSTTRRISPQSSRSSVTSTAAGR